MNCIQTTLLLVLASCAPGLAFAHPSARPQDTISPELLDLAKQRAELERRAAFLNEWVRATPNVQAHASRMLIAERDGAVRTSAAPSARALTKAWRVLRDGTPDSFAPNTLRDFAESLDLRVVPGLYSGKPEGLPEALTVQVSSIYPMPLEKHVQCSLFWLGADGEEIRARTEPVDALAFQGTGFSMYVRAPSSVPGNWKLVCELRRQDERGRGFPVPVLGVDLRDELLMEGDGKSKRTKFDQLVQHGVRPLFFSRFLGELGVLPVGSDEPQSGAQWNAIDHEVFRTLESQGVSTWSVGVAKTQSPATIVLLLRPEDELPEAAFVGAASEAWATPAESNKWWVLSSDLPLRSEEGPSLLTLASELARWKPETKLILVARGAAFLEVQLEQLRKPEWIFDRFVASTALGSKSRPRNLPAMRTLVVSSESAERGTENLEPNEGVTNTWIRRATPRIVTDLELPELLREWLLRKD